MANNNKQQGNQEQRPVTVLCEQLSKLLEKGRGYKTRPDKPQPVLDIHMPPRSLTSGLVDAR